VLAGAQFLRLVDNSPVDKGSLSIHQVELVIEAGPGFSDGSSVGQHADGTLNLGQITSRDDSWGLVVDPDLESGWTPINELDGSGEEI